MKIEVKITAGDKVIEERYETFDSVDCFLEMLSRENCSRLESVLRKWRNKNRIKYLSKMVGHVAVMGMDP